MFDAEYSIIFALDGVNTQSRESVLRVQMRYSTAKQAKRSETIDFLILCFTQ